MLNGCPPSQGKTLSLCRSAALYRLFPPVHTGARLGGHAWWTFIAITSLAHFVWRCGLQSFRVQFRCALRCFPAALQTALWTRDFKLPQAAAACRNILDTTCGFSSSHTPSGIVYVCLDEHYGSWYIGRCKNNRAINGKLWAASAIRAREHFSAAFAGWRSNDEARYRLWRKIHPAQLVLVPLFDAPIGQYERLEENLIALAGPTFQKHQRPHANFKPRKPGRRPFPRFRTAPQPNAEPSHNYLTNILCDLDREPRWRLWRPWPEWLRLRHLCFGESEVDITTGMYAMVRDSLDSLATFAGTASHRLDWKCMWRGGGPGLAYRVWRHAGFLPPAPRERARKKMVRFLAGTADCHPFTIHIPCADDRLTPLVRRVVRECLAAHPALLGDSDRSFVLSRCLRYVRTSPTLGCDMLTDHFKAARKARMSMYDKARTAPTTSSYGIVLRDHCTFPPACPTESTCKAVCTSMWSFLARSVTPAQPAEKFCDFLLSALLRATGSRTQLNDQSIDRITHIQQIRRRGCVQLSLATGSSLSSADVVAVPLDRDLRRRCFIRNTDYVHHLYHAFLSNPTVYALSPLSPTDALEQKALAARCHYAGLAAASAAGIGLCYAYVLPKAKCFSPFGTWTCARTHEHWRTIVAAPSDCLARKAKLAARCLLLLVRQRGFLSFPVQNQGRLRAELLKNDGKLRRDCSPRCLCCAKEKPLVAGCKLDASSFFTRCPVKKCVDIATSLVDLFQKRGVEVIWLSRDRSQPDRFAKRDTPVPERFRVVPLEVVCVGVAWLLEPAFIVVGDSVFIQISGLAQGNALSPVLARALLDTSHDKLFRAPSASFPTCSAIVKIGHRCKTWLGLSYHVDDSLWWSYSVCTSCLVLVVSATWDPELGLTVESLESSFDYLHTTITFQQQPLPHLSIHIRMPNSQFSLGVVDHPTVCGFSPYVLGVSSPSQTRAALNAKLWLLAANYTAASQKDLTRRIALLVAELIRLGWPSRVVANMLLSYRNHTFRFVTSHTLRVGQWLRSHRRLVWSICNAPSPRPDYWTALVEKLEEHDFTC